MYKFTKIHKALAKIYIEVEATTNPTDVYDSRPRSVSKEFSEVHATLCHVLEEHYEVEEDTFILGVRKYIREAIPISGCIIGYADEGLSLAQMVTRASPTGYGVRWW